MGINTPGTELQNHIGKQTVAGQLPNSTEFTNYEPAAVKLACAFDPGPPVTAHAQCKNVRLRTRRQAAIIALQELRALLEHLA